MADALRRARAATRAVLARVRVGSGIASDVRGRLPHYADDWVQGTSCGIRCLPPHQSLPAQPCQACGACAACEFSVMEPVDPLDSMYSATRQCMTGVGHRLSHSIHARQLGIGSHVQDGAVCRVLAPAVYIFFCSAIPALAFGQQLAQATDGVRCT